MLNFEELLRQHNVPVAPSGHHHARRGWVQFDCPLCSPNTHRWRAGYNVRSHYANCWSCGRLRLADTLATLCSLPWATARSLVADLPRGAAPAQRQLGTLKLPGPLRPLADSHIDYLRDVRGYPDVDALARLWGIQGLGWDGAITRGDRRHSLAHRVYLPIILDGKVVSWTTRSLCDDATLRYSSAAEDEEAYPHKWLLYGEDYCRHACIVVEGPLDAWRIGPGCVATCGTSYSSQQAARIASYLVRGICFDMEPAAQRRADKLARDLSVMPGETYLLRLESAKDADAADPAEIAEMRALVLA